MGVEPTAARSARPATGFEDRGAHRDPTTPADTHIISDILDSVKGRVRAFQSSNALKYHQHLILARGTLLPLSLFRPGVGRVLRRPKAAAKPLLSPLPAGEGEASAPKNTYARG